MGHRGSLIVDSNFTPPPPPKLPGGDWLLAWKPPRFYIRGHLFVHAIALMIVAAHMALFPGIYTPDTWQGLLFIVSWASPRHWAVIFALVALLKLLAGFIYPRMAVVAIIGGVLIMCWWTVGLTFSAFVSPNGDVDRATIIPAVLSALVLSEHFAAASLRIGSGRRWVDDQDGP